MALAETIHRLNHLLILLAKDLIKVQRGNKSAAQRVRVYTIQLTKTGKLFRKESLAAEKSGRFKKKGKTKGKKKR